MLLYENIHLMMRSSGHTRLTETLTASTSSGTIKAHVIVTATCKSGSLRYRLAHQRMHCCVSFATLQGRHVPQTEHPVLHTPSHIALKWPMTRRAAKKGTGVIKVCAKPSALSLHDICAVKTEEMIGHIERDDDYKDWYSETDNDDKFLVSSCHSCTVTLVFAFCIPRPDKLTLSSNR